MRGGQMFLYRSIIVWPHVSLMDSYTEVLMVDLHLIRCVHDFYLLSDMLVRNTIIMFVFTQQHMSVLHYRGKSKLLDFVSFNGKFGQLLLFYFIKHLSA